MPPATRENLGNKDVIAVDQDSLGVQGMLVQEPGIDLQVWSKPGSWTSMPWTPSES